jgi:hypothetical protein
MTCSSGADREHVRPFSISLRRQDYKLPNSAEPRLQRLISASSQFANLISVLVCSACII